MISLFFQSLLIFSCERSPPLFVVVNRKGSDFQFLFQFGVIHFINSLFRLDAKPHTTLSDFFFREEIAVGILLTRNPFEFDTPKLPLLIKD